MNLSEGGVDMGTFRKSTKKYLESTGSPEIRKLGGRKEESGTQTQTQCEG